ncbi:MAG TPA: cobyrinate a,c-diamide synthase [Bryobacteraceae bacterium]|nr:cobyrinate a,c-diamide synthase [Bryobacteraceae bacterium]
MIPRIVIAGTHSGVGKTTVAIALMAALVRRGMRVQPFKVGPDFIDPSFHTRVTGLAGRNLDGWMLSRDTNLALFSNAAKDADIAVIEGVMGAFDGHGPTSESGSTVELAKWLGAPIVLVIDASAMARSAAALIRGFETFDPEAHFAGVIFNRVGSVRHHELLRAAVEQTCSVQPLGALPRDPKISLPERHLGLVMANEVLNSETISRLADWFEAGVDVDRLLALTTNLAAIVPSVPLQSVLPVRRARIGVARDAAFCFYYQDNLDLLRHFGADLVEFSPLHDARLPLQLDGLYLGGGYPELHASALAANSTMLDDIRRFKGCIYAECGGFMYLTCEIVDTNGVPHAMAGVFPTSARMQKTRSRLGYVTVQPVAEWNWLSKQMNLRGHEFRYSEIDEMPAHIARRYRIQSNQAERAEGYSTGRVLAGYVHLHFASCPEFAEGFVRSSIAAQSDLP